MVTVTDAAHRTFHKTLEQALERLTPGPRASRVAVAEIAGRDSVAAVLQALAPGQIRQVVPAAVFTGTEYGNWDVVEQNTALLRLEADKRFGVDVDELVLYGSPALWRAINGRFLAVQRFLWPDMAPCVGCHLYMHLMRVPIAWKVGANSIIAGERESHDGEIKVNQQAGALDGYQKVISAAGLELALPLRLVASGEEIERILGARWASGDKQLKCVLSGNYRDLSGKASEIADGVLCDYFENFAVPVGVRLFEWWGTGLVPDYEILVSEVLSQVCDVKGALEGPSQGSSK